MESRVAENLRERSRRPVRNKRYNRSEGEVCEKQPNMFSITTTNTHAAINKISHSELPCDANGTAVIILGR